MQWQIWPLLWQMVEEAMWEEEDDPYHHQQSVGVEMMADGAWKGEGYEVKREIIPLLPG